MMLGSVSSCGVRLARALCGNFSCEVYVFSPDCDYIDSISPLFHYFGQPNNVRLYALDSYEHSSNKKHSDFDIFPIKVQLR
jgi:hypothetical protein